jgi:protein gp37
MGEMTKIEWADHTFNPWVGCTKVSPGCAHCYAEAHDNRFGGGHWGKGAPRQRTSEANWRKPVQWNRAAVLCENCGGAFTSPCHHFTDAAQTHRCPNVATGYRRPRVFCASLADWLDDEVPIEWLADLLGLIHATPSLDWLLLTKRPQNFHSRIEAALEPASWPGRSRYVRDWLQGTPPANVWIGTTVEDQQRLDERIPELLKIPACVRFLSCEPLLGPIDFAKGGCAAWMGLIEWVICGGESGPRARPMHPDWARSLRDQCAAAGVPFFFKQWGEWFPGHTNDGFIPDEDHLECGVPEFGRVDVHAFPPERDGTYQEMGRLGKRKSGRVLDLREHDAFPAGLRGGVS